MKTKGFTLVEVLVVMALLAIFALIAFPVFRQSVSQAKSTNCLSNVRQLVVSQLLYFEDWQAYPGEVSGNKAVVQRLGGVRFECPAADPKWRSQSSYSMLPFPADSDPPPRVTRAEQQKYVNSVSDCFEKRGGDFPLVLDMNHMSAKELYRGSGIEFFYVGRQSGSVDKVFRKRMEEVLFTGEKVPCDERVKLYNL